MPTRHPWIVTYDITNHRRRREVYRLLGGFGENIQKSVFLCHLDLNQRNTLRTHLDKLLSEEDRLAMLPLYRSRTLDMEQEKLPLSLPLAWIEE